MPKIEIPNCLTQVSKNNFKRLESSIPGKALFLFKLNYPFDTELSVFRTPFNFANEKNYFGIENFGDRMKNLGWYIREYQPRIKKETTDLISPPFDEDLWNSFSEQLIMNKIKDNNRNIYEIHCDQTFATTGTYGLDSTNAYFFSGAKKDLTKAFNFSSKKLLGNFRGCDFPDDQIKKLSEFMYGDFTALRYSDESRRIGQEADAIFF